MEVVNYKSDINDGSNPLELYNRVIVALQGSQEKDKKYVPMIIDDFNNIVRAVRDKIKVQLHSRHMPNITDGNKENKLNKGGFILLVAASQHFSYKIMEHLMRNTPRAFVSEYPPDEPLDIYIIKKCLLLNNKYKGPDVNVLKLASAALTTSRCIAQLAKGGMAKVDEESKVDLNAPDSGWVLRCSQKKTGISR